MSLSKIRHFWLWDCLSYGVRAPPAEVLWSHYRVRSACRRHGVSINRVIDTIQIHKIHFDFCFETHPSFNSGQSISAATCAHEIQAYQGGPSAPCIFPAANYDNGCALLGTKAAIGAAEDSVPGNLQPSNLPPLRHSLLEFSILTVCNDL